MTLKSVLDKAGVKAGSLQVRFNGLDQPVVADGPDFMKSLAIDHARDGEVMIAFAMNGQQLPLLNGFPLRLVVPGWYATYWMKMLNDIEVLDQPDTNFWMKTCLHHSRYPARRHEAGSDRRVDDTDQPHEPALVRDQPGRGRDDSGRQADAGARHRLRRRHRREAGGILQRRRQDLAAPPQLGKDAGKYSFRRWEAHFTPAAKGSYTLMVRCTNSDGVAQPDQANWNPAGFMRNIIETTHGHGGVRSEPQMPHLRLQILLLAAAAAAAVWRGANGAGPEIDYGHAAGELRHVSARTRSGCRQCQLSGVSLGGHGHEPAGPAEGSVGGGGQQDAQRLQGPGAGSDVAAIIDYLVSIKGPK